VGLAVRDEGDGPAVLLLHGFPDSSHVWRHQIPALVAGGFRVVAPDLRGFGDSDKPADVEAYAVPHLVADILAILDALALDRVRVVGHDWGAGLAWGMTAFAPQRVEKLVAMSVGHPGTRREIAIEQREKSWYMLLFQFEGIAEELLMRDDWKLARDWLRGNGDVDRYVTELEKPGALTAGLNWYRANLHPRRELEPSRELPPISVPTLGLWSDGDDYLTEEQMLRSGEWVSSEWRYERVDGASHWLQLDAPDRVNELLLEFL
jgi:pimeloyl-ACP methyl ester carboxylesterase